MGLRIVLWAQCWAVGGGMLLLNSLTLRPRRPVIMILVERVRNMALAVAPAMSTSAELLSPHAEVHTAPVRDSRPRRVVRILGAATAVVDWLFGVGTLIVGLAVLATVPVAQMLSLGYLLEVSGRTAREGRLRAGFVGVQEAARIGYAAVGIAVLMIPLWIASTLATAARLTAEHGRAAVGWRIALVVLTVLVILQIGSALLRGAKLRHFLIPRPVQTLQLALAPGAYARARDDLWNFVSSLQLAEYFWLGVRGFVGAAIWLVAPVSLLAAASQLPRPGAGVVTGLVGGALFAGVLLYLPFLQAQFAESGRFAAMFDLRRIRHHFVRAPIAFFFALWMTLALAIPLYLLKMELIPREAAWLPSLLFVVSIFPARLFTGWAMARGARREAKRGFFIRWPARLAMLPVVLVYVVVVYFTQYLSWYGVWSLYEQHSLLVPVPFFGL